MNLSTSNFRSYLVQFLVTLSLCLVGYEASVRSSRFRYGGGVGKNDWQNCKIRAQSYLYDLAAPQTVIVGSSLSARIRTRYLPPEVYNLAYPCLKGLTGLRVALAHPNPPQKIILQVHQALEETEKMDADLLDPLWLGLRKSFKSLRQEYRPVIILKQLVSESTGYQYRGLWFLNERIDLLTGQKAQFEHQPFPERLGPDDQKPIEEDVEKFLYNKFVAKYRILMTEQDGLFVPTEKYLRQLEKLKLLIAIARDKGIELSLNQMPIKDNFAKQINYQMYLKQLAADLAPLQLYHQDGAFSFTDGLHMTDQSAIWYTYQLARQLQL